MDRKTTRRKRIRPGNPHLAVTYVRVSTHRQALGPDVQRTLMQRWATEHDVKIVDEYLDDGVSGAREHLEREGLQAALIALKTYGAGILLVAKRDRLARDMEVVVVLEREVRRAGASIVAADFCEAHKLERVDFEHCLDLVPELKEHISVLAAQRLQELNKVSSKNGLSATGCRWPAQQQPSESMGGAPSMRRDRPLRHSFSSIIRAAVVSDANNKFVLPTASAFAYAAAEATQLSAAASSAASSTPTALAIVSCAVLVGTPLLTVQLVVPNCVFGHG